LHASLLSEQEYSDYTPLVVDSAISFQPDLDAIIAFRELLYGVFHTLSLRQPVTDEALQQINLHYQQGTAWRVLRAINGVPAWGWRTCTSTQELTSMLIARLATDATQLLVSSQL
ncbi:ABATE domain-containing protein, partial [Pseudomonas viridiflava]|uniref:ABATE domain-containing protein n=1 Tax=Pseudomonas viridiflava TaxID=33069 RepID=UPI0019D0816D